MSINEARFWAKVDVRGPDECWLWTGCVDKDGYGVSTAHEKKMATHRVSYLIKYGEIKRGLYVCHACDVPACVNPAHLWLGTQSDNVRDAYAKGRVKKKLGEANAASVLTENDVVFIRTSSLLLREIAQKFGISEGHVSQIQTGKNWKHLGLVRTRRRAIKLTEHQVTEIRGAVGSQSKIAAKYGVSQSVVSEIKSKKAWKPLSYAPPLL